MLWRACHWLFCNLPIGAGGLLGAPEAASSSGWASPGPSASPHRVSAQVPAVLVIPLPNSFHFINIFPVLGVGHKRTEYSKCSVMSVDYRWIINSPDLPPMLWLIKPRILLASFASSARCWLMFSLVSWGPSGRFLKFPRQRCFPGSWSPGYAVAQGSSFTSAELCIFPCWIS